MSGRLKLRVNGAAFREEGPPFILLMGAALSCGLRTEPGRIDVGLYATFQHAPSAAVREAVHKELSAAVNTLGILVHWRSKSERPERVQEIGFSHTESNIRI